MELLGGQHCLLPHISPGGSVVRIHLIGGLDVVARHRLATAQMRIVIAVAQALGCQGGLVFTLALDPVDAGGDIARCYGERVPESMSLRVGTWSVRCDTAQGARDAGNLVLMDCFSAVAWSGARHPFCGRAKVRFLSTSGNYPCKHLCTKAQAKAHWKSDPSPPCKPRPTPLCGSPKPPFAEPTCISSKGMFQVASLDAFLAMKVWAWWMPSAPA